MPARHLVDDALEHVAHGELAGLARHLAMEHDLEEQVSELLDQVVDVALVDGLEHLVGLLDQVRLEGGTRLFAVPGATALAPQPRQQGEQGIETSSGGSGHDGSRGLNRHYTQARPLLEGCAPACYAPRRGAGELRWRRKRRSRSPTDADERAMRRRPSRP